MEASGSTPAIPLPGFPNDFEGKNAPWLKFNFETEPESQPGFRPQNNLIRNWYHAPWMQYCPESDKKTYGSVNEREPINGLTFERATPAFEFANTRVNWLQNWACGFYNATGATVFGDMWKDPNNPDFSKDKHFPTGTFVFKILLNNATNDELPMMEGSPSLDAMISALPKNGGKPPAKAGPRNNFASPLRLIQVDFAVVDERAPIGWVFGTFMFNSELTNMDSAWDKLTLVGLQWGNDPDVTQDAHNKVVTLKESWINPKAEALRVKFKGSRPSWGWNSRLNGPADNYISACASCHSTASRDPMPLVSGPYYSLVPPTDRDVMTYFRNVPAGTHFDEGLDKNVPKSKTKSADYSLQLQMGYCLYNTWLQDSGAAAQILLRRTKYVVTREAPVDPAHHSQRDTLRQGPDLEFEKK